MLKRITCLLLLISGVVLLYSTSTAQKGEIAGFVQDRKTRETLIGANVIIKGTTLGVSTDIDGKFRLAGVDPGIFSIEVSYISYRKLVIEGVEVNPDQTTDLEIFLEEDARMLEGIVVRERRKTDTEISIISAVKASNVAVTGMSRQQISRSLDKNAAEAMRRVPGVTIMDGRFIVVRGLIDRYNTVWLNGSATPSFESDKRSFSFDILPTSSLDRMMIYKTPAPELPADFAGASIQLFTRNIPEKNSLSIGYKMGFREGTTFRNFYTYEGGKTDWLGFDDGTRALPDNFPSTQEIEELHNWDDLGLPPEEMQKILAAKRASLEELGRSFNKIWDRQNITAPIDNSLEVEFNHRLTIGKMIASNITALTYRNEFNHNVIRNSKYLYNEDLGIIDTNFNFSDHYYRNEIMVGLLHNWCLMLKDGTMIEFRNLLNQISFDNYAIRTGRDYYREAEIESHELGYMSRSTYSGQLGAKHELYTHSSIDWSAGFAYADRKDPDIRRLYGTLNDDTASAYYGQYSIEFLADATPELNGRLFLSLDERIWNGAVNYRYKVHLGNFHPEIRAGVYYEGKNRHFIARNLGFVRAFSNQFNTDIEYIRPFGQMYADSNITYPTGILLDEKTHAEDSYKAENTLIAAYLAFNIPITIRLNLYAGVRMEQNRQKLYDFYKNSADDSLAIVIDTMNFFPSANLSWDLTERSKVRLAYGMTVNRPEFREIAPYSYYDFVNASQMYGNGSLRNAYIHSFDLRYEYYPSSSEMITAGAFYKLFIDPIENTLIPVTTDKWTFQPWNAKESTSLGFEMDIKKSFCGLAETNGFLHSFRDISLVFNAAWIWSEVREKKAFVRDEKRPMQGQSPYIVNAGIHYDNRDIGLVASILYNVIGKRIVFVGDPNTPHTYEMPRNLLEFSFTKSVGEHLKIRGGVEDILDEPVKYQQSVEFLEDTNEDGVGDTNKTYDQVLKSFYPGRKYSLGIVYTF